MRAMFLFVLAVSVAVAALTSTSLVTRTSVSQDNVLSQAGNAAFRDGLHLGRFDAQSGRTRHVSVGRWSSNPDRSWFIAGYEAGYLRGSAATTAAK